MHIVGMHRISSHAKPCFWRARRSRARCLLVILWSVHSVGTKLCGGAGRAPQLLLQDRPADSFLQEKLTSLVLVDTSQTSCGAVIRPRNSCVTSEPVSAACHALQEDRESQSSTRFTHYAQRCAPNCS